ncbi:MAG: MFS transporter [Clostridia bacterium]|nr:MFS transporter [Clostridia bacterium]
MTSEQQNFRQFGIRDKIGYLLGDLGNDFTFILSSSFLLKFYTDVMNVPAAVVGIIMMIARFVDAFTDVAMGRICDKRKATKGGKFKPWILRMCGPVALSSFLIYQSSLKDTSLNFKIIWLAITYILWGSFFYTSINIPYGSMASAISREPDDRQSLSTFRTMGSTLAGVIIGAGIPLFAYKNVDGLTILSGGAFTFIAGLFSILAIISYILCYFFTTERIVPPQHVKGDNLPIKKLLSNLLSNKALISIIAASVLMLLAQLTMQSMANYVYPNFYKNTAAQSVSTITMMGSMLVAAAIAKPLARKLGKAELSAAANLLAGGISLLLFFIRQQNVWVYTAWNVISCLGLGIFAMVSWALITDVIVYSEIKNGIREDGSIYALYSFSRKLGQAGAAGLSGGLLSLIGYSQENAFSEPILNGIFNISTLIPAIGFIGLAFILWFWYPLKKRAVDNNVQILKQKHGSGF